jgi:hypothetical protein
VTYFTKDLNICLQELGVDKNTNIRRNSPRLGRASNPMSPHYKPQLLTVIQRRLAVPEVIVGSPKIEMSRSERVCNFWLAKRWCLSPIASSSWTQLATTNQYLELATRPLVFKLRLHKLFSAVWLCNCRRLIDGQWMYLKAVFKNSQVQMLRLRHVPNGISWAGRCFEPASSTFKAIPLLLQECSELSLLCPSFCFRFFPLYSHKMQRPL